MPKIGRRIISLAASWVAVALLAATCVAAQGNASQVRTVPHLTGTITLWNGHRLEMKNPDGKIQKVAVNEDTERQVELKVGTEVTVEYHRRISGFVIAQRILAAQLAPPPGPATTPAASTVTGSVVSWSAAALVLRTDAGDVTLFLSPSTEYLVKPLDPGLLVTVEYHEGADLAKVATRVLAAKEKPPQGASAQ